MAWWPRSDLSAPRLRRNPNRSRQPASTWRSFGPLPVALRVATPDLRAFSLAQTDQQNAACVASSGWHSDLAPCFACRGVRSAAQEGGRYLERRKRKVVLSAASSLSPRQYDTELDHDPGRQLLMRNRRPQHRVHPTRRSGSKAQGRLVFRKFLRRILASGFHGFELVVMSAAIFQGSA